MLSSILLFSLIAIVILGVIRASKQKHPGARPQKEPFVGKANHQSNFELAPEVETVGKPRVISTRQQPSEPAIDLPQNRYETALPDEGIVAVRRPTHQVSPEQPVEQPPSVSPPPIVAIDSDTSASPEVAPTPVKPTPTANIEPETEEEAPPDVIAIHLFAEPGRPYRGYELLQAMLTVGLRYGKWNIFHRHEEITGRGPLLFSLASTIEPGTFDLAKMGSFSSPGLVLFMRISKVQNPRQAFDKLIAAAQQLVGELGGTLHDEQRQPLSSDKVTRMRAMLQRTQQPALSHAE